MLFVDINTINSINGVNSVNAIYAILSSLPICRIFRPTLCDFFHLTPLPIENLQL